MTGIGAKAIFKKEVITHKEELYSHLSKVEKSGKDHMDIISSVEEAKVVAVAKVESVVHHIETLRKELAEVETKFNELKRNESNLD